MGKDAVILGGNWNNGANSGSRCSNWNNSASNSNNNIGVRCACDDISISLYKRYGFICRPSKIWSAIFTCFGKYIVRFRMPLVSMRTGLLA
jgi:hypothetical protein